MDFNVSPKQIGVANYKGEHCAIVEIICPICNSDRVEPLPSLYNAKWLCCRCETVFTVESLIGDK